MWANVAVTAHPSRARLEKFLGKITAYFAVRMGVDLTHADFAIKMKKIRTPMHWEKTCAATTWPSRGGTSARWRGGKAGSVSCFPETDLEML